MSIAAKPRPVTIETLLRKKQLGEKIISLTAYDYTTARLVDSTGVDFLLVGDSLAMTVLGHPNTLSVTVDEMLHHTKAVVRGTRQAMVVADMPFMSYTVDHTSAIENAGRFIKEGGCAAVKLEGAHPQVLDVISHLTRIGIPVMGHLGFTPQSVHTMGGFKVQGKTIDAVKQMVEDARNLQKAGVFSLVLEMIPIEVARGISEMLDIPTIGIGSGNVCDGQILVIDDMLGRYPDLSPRFVRRYMASDELIAQAVSRYRQDIESSDFPNNEHEAFHFPAEQQETLKAIFSAHCRKTNPSEAPAFSIKRVI